MWLLQDDGYIVFFQKISDLITFASTDDHQIYSELLHKIKCRQQLLHGVAMHKQFLLFIQQALHRLEFEIRLLMSWLRVVGFCLAKKLLEGFDLIQSLFDRIAAGSLRGVDPVVSARWS